MPFPNPSTQFKSGAEWNGNPGGRPTGRSLTARMRELLEKGQINGQPIKDGKQVADMVSELWLKGALQGDFRFLKEILDRTEGKVPERVVGPDGGAIQHEVTHRIEIVEVLVPENEVCVSDDHGDFGDVR